MSAMRRPRSRPDPMRIRWAKLALPCVLVNSVYHPQTLRHLPETLDYLSGLGLRQIFLNPDCGFGCFANRCVNDEESAARKIRNIVKAAQRLREKHG